MKDRKAGILTYGVTPPKKSYSEERRRELATKQSARIATLPVDGLVVYDIQDESARTDVARPFPYLECIDPVSYAYDYLEAVHTPKVVYHCVGPHDAESLDTSLSRVSESDDLCVLVGAASRQQTNALKLPEAYALKNERHPGLLTGGVLIAERHAARQGEDARILRKMDQGCSFFITQAVYSVVASKNVLSDLYYRCRERVIDVPPVLVTLSPCGSRKTLQFMSWLGVSVPRWLENELLHSEDILQTSVDICAQVFEDLLEFSLKRGIPLGCNVESVSLRKAEIDASVELTERVAKLLGRG